MIKRLFLSVMAIVIVIGSPMAFASGNLPGSGWWTSEIVQNVSGLQTGTGTAATIVVTAYGTGPGAASYTASTASLADGASTTFLPGSFSGMNSGFSGAGVVSSSQPVVAVGYLTNQLSGSYGTSGGKAADYFQGMSAPNTTLYFSNAKDQWCNTTILYYIQNTGGSPTTVQVVYAMGITTSYYTYTTPSIQPNQMIVVSPADAAIPLPANLCDTSKQTNIGSATLTSAQPIAAMYVEYRTNETTSTTISALRAFTPADVAQKAYVPVVKYNWASRYNGIPILNVANVPITVTVNYLGTAGSCLGNNYVDSFSNLGPGQGTRFVMAAGLTQLPPSCVAAATITGTGNFLAIVNEANVGGTPPAGSVYYAFPDGTTTHHVALPVFTDNRFGITGGLQVQNTSPTTATITATFNCLGNGNTNTPFTAISKPIQIGSGSSFLFYRPSTTQQSSFTGGNPFNISNSVCAVAITSDQNIVGLYNEVSLTTGALDDARYNAFNP